MHILLALEHQNDEAVEALMVPVFGQDLSRAFFRVFPDWTVRAYPWTTTEMTRYAYRVVLPQGSHFNPSWFVSQLELQVQTGLLTQAAFDALFDGPNPMQHGPGSIARDGTHGGMALNSEFFFATTEVLSVLFRLMPNQRNGSVQVFSRALAQHETFSKDRFTIASFFGPRTPNYVAYLDHVCSDYENSTFGSKMLTRLERKPPVKFGDDLERLFLSYVRPLPFDMVFMYTSWLVPEHHGALVEAVRSLKIIEFRPINTEMPKPKRKGEPKRPRMRYRLPEVKTIGNRTVVELDHRYKMSSQVLFWYEKHVLHKNQ
jgi:hypothetical protein